MGRIPFQLTMSWVICISLDDNLANYHIIVLTTYVARDMTFFPLPTMSSTAVVACDWCIVSITFPRNCSLSSPLMIILIIEAFRSSFRSYYSLNHCSKNLFSLDHWLLYKRKRLTRGFYLCNNIPPGSYKQSNTDIYGTMEVIQY